MLTNTLTGDINTIRVRRIITHTTRAEHFHRIRWSLFVRVGWPADNVPTWHCLCGDSRVWQRWEDDAYDPSCKVDPPCLANRDETIHRLAVATNRVFGGMDIPLLEMEFTNNWSRMPFEFWNTLYSRGHFLGEDDLRWAEWSSDWWIGEAVRATDSGSR